MGGRHGALRALVAVLAVAVIVFCAWSASEYAAGRDPLGFLAGSTTAMQDASQGGSGAAANEAQAAESQLTSEEVRSYISNDLEFSGAKATVSGDDFQVYLAGSGVWVEQKSSDDAPTLVQLTAERAAALAQWMRGEGAQTQGVTWITEDIHGIIRVVVWDSLDVEATGDTSGLLGASEGYLISPETYEGLGDVSCPASAGETPKLPDGTELEVDAIVSTDESGNATGTTLVSADDTQRGAGQGSSSDATTSAEPTQENAPSGGSEGSQGQGSATASSSGNAGGSSSAGTESQITVTVAINGSSTSVSVPEGSTAYEALLATGASVNAGPNPYGAGTWVYGINGQDQGTSSSHGWTYTVDGTLPGVMSDLYVLSDGSTVSWNFV